MSERGLHALYQHPLLKVYFAEVRFKVILSMLASARLLAALLKRACALWCAWLGFAKVAACTHAIAAFGTEVTLLKGPPKKQQRILEKARDGDYR